MADSLRRCHRNAACDMRSSAGRLDKSIKIASMKRSTLSVENNYIEGNL
jgi:hypothetical protein